MGRHFLLEVSLLLRSRLFIAMAVVLIAVAAISGFQGGELARLQADSIEAARMLEVRTDDEARAKAERIRSGDIDPPWWQNPLNVQSWSYTMVRHVALPPMELAGVAIADADIQPFLYRISPHPPDRWSNRSSELTPSIAAYGGFDLAEVLLMLTPLVVVVAYADIIRDRNGSERQRLAIIQATDERQLLACRLLPRGIVVLVITSLAGLTGVAATSPSLTVNALYGACVIVLVAAGHGLFWLALASGLVFAFRAAVATFAVFVTLWFVLGILAPVIVDGTSRLTHPPPPQLAVFAAERTELVRARVLEDDLTRDYADSDPLARDMLLSALREERLLITPTNLLVQKEVDQRRAEARESERLQRAEFVRRAGVLSSFSPTLVARRSLHSHAGRDQARRAVFDEQVATYHTYLQETFGTLLMRRATLGYVLLPERFEFREPE